MSMIGRGTVTLITRGSPMGCTAHAGIDRQTNAEQKANEVGSVHSSVGFFLPQ